MTKVVPDCFLGEQAVPHLATAKNGVLDPMDPLWSDPAGLPLVVSSQVFCY